MTNSFHCFLSGKLFICPSVLNDGFVGQSNLGYRFPFFMILNISCQSLLACKVSFEKPANSFMGTPLQVTLCFFLAAFKILFIFNLWHFTYDVSWCGPLWVQLVSDSLCFLDLHVYFLHQIREVFFHYFFKQSSNFLLSLLLLAPP